MKPGSPGKKFDLLKTKFDLLKTKLDFRRTRLDLPRIKLDLLKTKFHPGRMKLGQHLQRIIKKTSSFTAASIFILIVVTASYFIFFRNRNSQPPNISIKNERPHKGATIEKKSSAIVIVDDPAPSLTHEQIKAILYDTAGINHFTEQPNNELPLQADSATKMNINGDDNVQDDFENTADDRAQSYGKNLQIKYKVVDTTFFHNEPIVGSRRKTFLDPLNNNVLNSLQDKNGFIYIVYTNALGRTSKGWINKKDLKPLR